MKIARRFAYGVAAALKWLAYALFALGFGLMVAFFVYDATEFQPRRAQIDAMLASAKPLERSPPRMLIRLQRADAGDAVSLLASRTILFELDRGVGQRSNLEWKSRSLLWMWLVDLHLSEDEELLIVRAFTFLGKRTYGFGDGALSVFGRPLDELTDQELASLVVIARWPYRHREPERAADLERAAAALLERVRSARQPAL